MISFFLFRILRLGVTYAGVESRLSTWFLIPVFLEGLCSVGSTGAQH